MTCFVVFFFVAVCSIFTRKHWFTVKWIRSFSWSSPNLPPLLQRCHSFLAPLPGDANRTPSTFSAEWHLARGSRLFHPPGSVHVPPHTSPLAHPRRLPAADLGTAGPLVQLCNGMVFPTYAEEEYVHYCRRTQARAFVHPCPLCAVGPAGCASCAQGQAATPPKEQRKSVFTIAWEPGIKVCPRRRWKREETQGMPAEGSRKRTGTSVCTYTSTWVNLLHCNTQVSSPLFSNIF